MDRKFLTRASLLIAMAGLLGSAVPGSTQTAGLYRVEPDGAVSQADLRAAIDPLFDDSDVGRTRALVVMHDGQIVAERYAPGFGPDTKLVSWSVAKTITAVLVGLMVSDGRLALDAPAPVPAWGDAGDPRGTITLRHLLTMSSGLTNMEGVGDPASDSTRILFTDGAADMAAFAEGKPLAHKPGRQFAYSTASTMILSDIVTRMLTDSPDPEQRRAAMAQFIEGRLAQPVGLSSLTPQYDAHGTLAGGALIHMTARDYARFGEFLRQRGRANGRQILSQRWVDFMTTPSNNNPRYGGQLWLNRDRAGEAPMFAGPSSLFAAVGIYGQYVVVSPIQGLTIVRLGVSEGDQENALRTALGRIIALY